MLPWHISCFHSPEWDSREIIVRNAMQAFLTLLTLGITASGTAQTQRFEDINGLEAMVVAKFGAAIGQPGGPRSEEHTSELQSLMRISYAVLCLKKKIQTTCKKK